MASIKRRKDRGNKWQARYRDDTGKEHAQLFDRKVDGERWLDQQRGDLARGVWVDPDAGKVTVKAYGAVWLDRQLWRDGTRSVAANALRHLNDAMGKRELKSVTKTDVAAFVKALDLAPSTVATVHQHVRTMFNAAVEERVIGRNPAVGVKLPRIDTAPIVPLTAEQVWKLQEAAPPFLKAAVVVGAGLGLRQGEAMGLTRDRVDWLRQSVRVDRQLLTPLTGPPVLAAPKTASSYRTIPASAVVLGALAEHVAAFELGPDGLLFHEDGVAIKRNQFGRLWRATAAKAGLEGVTYHALRHHFASVLIAAGCSVKAVQEALGHASAKVTLDTYSHLWPTDHDRIRDAIQGVLGADPEELAEESRGPVADQRTPLNVKQQVSGLHAV